MYDIWMGTCLCMYACGARIYFYMHKFMCMIVHLSFHVEIWYIGMCIHTDINSYMYMNINVYPSVYTYPHIHVYNYACVHI